MAKKSTQDYAIALYNAIKGVTDKKITEQIIKNFVKVLFRARKIKQADKIMKEFENYTKKQEGIVKIEITSARDLDEKTLTTIKKSFGDKVEATTKVNEKLIGGIIVKEESTILDASLRTQLTKLKQKLS